MGSLEHPVFLYTKASITGYHGVGGGAVAWGTALQAGRSQVRFPDYVIGIFHLYDPSACTIALGSIQLLKEMSTRRIEWGIKVAGAWGWQSYHLHMPSVVKSGSLSVLESSGSLQACTWIAFTGHNMMDSGLCRPPLQATDLLGAATYRLGV